MNPIKSNLEDKIQCIANELMINSYKILNDGLLDGKMGIAIFLYRYSKYCNNELFANSADKLVDEIFENINNDSS